MPYKFKVGDIVKFTNEAIQDRNGNVSFFQKGFTNLIIRDVWEDDCRVYECDKSTSWSVDKSELELQDLTIKNWRGRINDL